MANIEAREPAERNALTTSPDALGTRLAQEAYSRDGANRINGLDRKETGNQMPKEFGDFQLTDGSPNQAQMVGDSMNSQSVLTTPKKSGK